MIEPSEILFMGISKTPVAWYRCFLPALHMGADWVGVNGQPDPKPHIVTGLVRDNTQLPKWEDYKVVVMQQPAGRRWLRLIRDLQRRGIKVIYEVDDYLHGVAKEKNHAYASHFGKEVMREYELCMKNCDAMIVSTNYLGRRYHKFNKAVHLSPNMLDVARYDLTRPKRECVNVGWAGATGHAQPLLDWLNALLPLLRERKDVNVVVIGQAGITEPLQSILGQQRVIGIPFTLIENYPAAMTMFDIALAPAGNTSWYRGKSDLRWLEAGALGIPLVADPVIYPDIEHGVTGFHAATPKEASELVRTLVDDRELGERVGQAARTYVHTERHIKDGALRWLEICRAVAGDYESVSRLARS